MKHGEWSPELKIGKAELGACFAFVYVMHGTMA